MKGADRQKQKSREERITWTCHTSDIRAISVRPKNTGGVIHCGNHGYQRIRSGDERTSGRDNGEIENIIRILGNAGFISIREKTLREGVHRLDNSVA